MKSFSFESINCYAKLFGFKLLAAAILAFIVRVQDAAGQASAVNSYQWKDRGGNEHVLPDIRVYGFDCDQIGCDAIPSADGDAGNGFTSDQGVFRFSATDLLIDNQIEFYFRTEARLGAGGREIARVEDSNGNVYYDVSPPTPPGAPRNYLPVNVGTTLSGAVTYGGGQGLGNALNILQYYRFIRNYYIDTHEADIPDIYFVHGADVTTTGIVTNERIYIDANDWSELDTVFHEVGHHIFHNNIAGLDSEADEHRPGTDNINGTGRWKFVDFEKSALGTRRGSQLAWAEGTATFLGMMAIHGGNMSSDPYLRNLPAEDFNTSWDFFKPAADGGSTDLVQFDDSYDLETNLYREGEHIEKAMRYLGEGDEGSVQQVLWDLFDSGAENTRYVQRPVKTADDLYRVNEVNWTLGSDRVSYSDKTIWSELLQGGGGDGEGNASFRQFWEDVATFAGTHEGQAGISGLKLAPRSNTAAKQREAVAALGEILGEAGIAGIPLTSTLDLNNPELQWITQNNKNSQFHRILVMTPDFSEIVYDSGRVVDQQFGAFRVLAENSISIPADAIPLGTYTWVVLNNPADYNLTNIKGPAAGTLGPAALADDFRWYWSGARKLVVKVPEPATWTMIGALLLAGAIRRSPCSSPQ